VKSHPRPLDAGDRLPRGSQMYSEEAKKMGRFGFLRQRLGKESLCLYQQLILLGRKKDHAAR